MYTSFFGLNETPFSITPNPRYLYMSERHTEALAHLIYGIKDSSGFVQLTGEVGTGKTTLIRSLLQRIPGNADVALVLNPQQSAPEFLISILTELKIPLPEDKTSLKALTDALNQFLLENHSKGRRTILIVDEAQNFAVDVLEQIRLLTNLETARQKLLQITLIGQPELRDMLARNDLRQLAQRVTGRYHLHPLSLDDTRKYIQHRLKVAGSTQDIFTPKACREIHRLTGGIPRIINVIADRALLGAYTRDQREVTPALARHAAIEVFGKDSGDTTTRNTLLKVAALAMFAAVLIGAAGFVALRYSATPAASVQQQNSPEATVSDTLGAPSPREPAADSALQDNVLETILQGNASKTDTKTAFGNLLALWDVPFDETANLVCEYAQQADLFCLFLKGSLTQVQKLDRPVILTLRDAVGGLHQVVLTAITSETAILSIGGTLEEVTLSDVNELWYGEYLLLWKPQIGAEKSFYPGMRDPDVIWLRTSLATIQGDPIEPMDSDYFDAPLEASVKEYQIARRLNVDGKVGQQTQILINSDLGAAAPHLLRAN
jgi:general secretion pathway protein A